jgi:hypothetical protein
MPRITTIGACEHCGKRFVANQYPAEQPKRFCSRKCKQAAYARLPRVRAQIAAAKRRRRAQKKRIAMRELLEAMQKEVPV